MIIILCSSDTKFLLMFSHTYLGRRGILVDKVSTFFFYFAGYRVRQKYLTILQNSCECNCWPGEFVLDRSSSETQSISVAMERWSVEHRAFAVETYFKKQRFCLDSEDISSVLQY